MRTQYADCCFPIVRLPVAGETCCTLMEPWRVAVGRFGLTLPAGVTTDGASIPRALWRLCGHPLESPRAYAALFHDYLYSGGVADCTRAEADRCYWLLLRHFGVGAVRAAVEYLALRAFGWSHWRR